MVSLEDVVTRLNPRAGITALLRRLPLPRRSMMRCDLCELTGGPFRAAEADALLQIHQQLQHGRYDSRGPALPPMATSD